VAFSSDAQLLASASRDYTVRLWNLVTGASCSTLKGHSGSVLTVAFSPDGQLLASASSDHTVRVWDMKTKEIIQTFDTKDTIYTLSFSSNGLYLETNQGILELKYLPHCKNWSQFNFPCPLYVDGHWITWRMEKLLWLPPDYRARRVAVYQNILAIGHSSGQVTFTEFDPDTIPFDRKCE
jgi:WD40 repeat protein